MDIISIAMTGIIITILATVTLAAVSYGAFKLRERHHPAGTDAEEAAGPLFFERIRLPEEPATNDES